MTIKKFNSNDKGKDFVVGDIHGNFSRLHEELHKLEFDKETDRLFSVGDLVDRGPESHLALGWLEQPWFHAVRGNHEDMAIEFMKGKWTTTDYAANGGEWFIQLPTPQQLETVAVFNGLPYIIEVDTPKGLVGIIHAQCEHRKWDDLKKAVENKYVEDILWGRNIIKNKINQVVEGVNYIYVGHTPVREKVVLGNHHYIDTGAQYGNPFHIEQIN